MKDLTSDKVIEFFCDQKPKIIWECGDDVLPQLKRMQDSNGQNLYGQRSPQEGNLTVFNEATFLGYPIYRIEGKIGLTLKFIFLDRTEKIVESIFQIRNEKV